jgi:hypothetical protein
MKRDPFDAMFDELLANGFVKQAGVGADGEPEYQLTGKADEFVERMRLHEKLQSKKPLTAAEQQRVNEIVAGLSKQN